MRLRFGEAMGGDKPLRQPNMSLFKKIVQVGLSREVTVCRHSFLYLISLSILFLFRGNDLFRRRVVIRDLDISYAAGLYLCRIVRRRQLGHFLAEGDGV